MTKPASVNAYIEAAAPAARRILRTIRATARKHAPGAQELLRYRIPALKSNGILLYYAAFKDHIGIFPPVRGDERLERALAPFRGPKGNLRFALDRPFPYALLARIVRLRVKQDAAGITRRT